MDDPSTTAHYKAPGWLTRRVFNGMVAGLTRLGVSVLGSRVLEVRGRTTGEPRRTPVNLLVLDGRNYLVSPRGQSQWVRNVRAANGHLALLLGRHRQEWVAREMGHEEAVPVLRAYLKRWKMEVGMFFEGVSDASPDEDLLRAAGRHPVFALEPVSRS